MLCLIQWKFHGASGNSETARWGIHWGLPAPRKRQLAQSELLQHRNTTWPSLALAMPCGLYFSEEHIMNLNPLGPSRTWSLDFPHFADVFNKGNYSMEAAPQPSTVFHQEPGQSWGVFPPNPGVWYTLGWRQAPFCSTQGDFPACKSA